MATTVVYNPNGAFIDDMQCRNKDFFLPTQVLPPGGVANTGGTVRVTSTPTVVNDFTVSFVVGANGV